MSLPNAPELMPAPPMDPARAAYLRRTIAALVGVTVDRMLAEASTGTPSSGSLSDRAMMAAVRPWVGKLRDGVLSRLSETDPADLEHWMGAIALALESIIAQAPGLPEPRYVIEWTPDGAPVLELCQECG